MRDFLGAVLSVTWVCQRFLAGLCRIGLTALLWHPRSPVPCPVHRLRVLTPQTAEAAAACQNRMQVLSLEMSPCTFFHIVCFHPKLTWAEGDSGGCGPSHLRQPILASAPNQGRSLFQSIWGGAGCWPKVAELQIRLPVENWSGEGAVQPRAVLSVAQLWWATELAYMYTWIFSRTHFSVKRHQTSHTENFLQKADLFLACDPP